MLNQGTQEKSLLISLESVTFGEFLHKNPFKSDEKIMSFCTFSKQLS
jgi:hypothetical protein